MFTIKWVREGGETLYRGNEIRYNSGIYEGPQGPDGRNGELLFRRDDGVDCSLDVGNVYVMNDFGKTVASYYLTPQPVDLETAP